MLFGTALLLLFSLARFSKQLDERDRQALQKRAEARRRDFQHQRNDQEGNPTRASEASAVAEVSGIEGAKDAKESENVKVAGRRENRSIQDLERRLSGSQASTSAATQQPQGGDLYTLRVLLVCRDAIIRV